MSRSFTGTETRFPALRSAGRAARDREFLPAALAIVETPPSPVGMALLMAICLLFTSALAWASIGKIDIVAVAPGKIEPQGRVKTIQSVATGRVTQILARNGAHVAVGTMLFTLDPGESQASEAELAASVAAFRAEAIRRATAAAQARAHAPVTTAIKWPADIPATVASTQDRVLRSDLDQLRSDVENLAAQVEQKRQEQKRLDLTIATQSELVATLQERVHMRETLMATGSGPKAAVLDARESLQTQAGNLAYQIGQRAEAIAAVAVAETAISKAYETFAADNTEKEAEAGRQADDYEHKLASAQVRGQQLTVTAPVAGTVHGSTLTTDGQVVSAGEELMRIVPESEALDIEAYLPNKDAGFVRPGQDVVIKVESFPFTRYGTLHGTVVRVAADAITAVEAEQTVAAPAKAPRGAGLAGAQTMEALVYPITVRLDHASMVADGRTVPLSPGMAVSAEITTGNRRLIEYILSPITDVVSTSLRER